VRSSLVNDLWNGGKGISVSVTYQQREHSRRKFLEDDHSQPLMHATFNALSQEWKKSWKQKQPPQELEMDFVAHSSTPPTANCDFGTNRLQVVKQPSSSSSSSSSSSTSSASSSSQYDDISPGKLQPANDHVRNGESDDAARRFYVVFEITRGTAKFAIRDKLLQLERDLTFLLLRHCEKHDTAATILDIVSYAGIAFSADNALDSVQKLLRTHHGALTWPHLTRLASQGRLLVFIGQPTLFDIVSVSTNMSPISPAIAAERLKREKIMTRRQEVELKKEEVELKMKEIALANLMRSPSQRGRGRGRGSRGSGSGGGSGGHNRKAKKPRDNKPH
jgi:hypothetical protein